MLARNASKKVVHQTVVALLFLTSLVFTARPANAYDEDTHFYGTYAMARYAGIKHEPAMKIALSAQWMDESYISDPTSMIFLPITGVKKRRLLHFPSSRVVGTLNASAQRSIFGIKDTTNPLIKELIDWLIEKSGFKGNLESINFLTETVEDHPFASELLMQGLKEGNLMMAAASLHTIEDSFAHAGTPAEQGHADFWHWPDRPFASTQKYFRMVRAAMSAIVAIRTMLPEAALDCQLKLAPTETLNSDPRPNCKQNAVTLAQNYSRQPQVVQTVTRDVLKEREYVLTALKDLFSRAVKAKYLKINNDSYKKVLESVNIEGMDSLGALETIVRELLRLQLANKTEFFDLKFLLQDMGRLQTSSAIQIVDYIESYGAESDALAKMDSDGMSNFIHAIAYELLRWTVPMPLSDSHRIEVEDDKSPVRAKEMEIRNRNMQNLIVELFGTEIKFVESNSKDAVGFDREVTLSPLAETPLPKASGNTLYATFSLHEKNAWDRMIFRYLFPDLKPGDLDILVGGALKLRSYLAERKEINDSDSNFVVKKAKLLTLDRDLFSSVHGKLHPMFLPYLNDIVGTHLIPSADNFFYRSTRLFQDYRSCNTVKPLLGPKDVWPLESLIPVQGQLTPR